MQTIHALQALCAAQQIDWTFEVKKIVTKGDRILDTSLAKVGGKGLFVKEIEEALLGGEIDLAVHSLKDMPAQLPDGLVIGAVPRRVDARDALISNHPGGLAGLPHGARVGTSSLRRSAQLLAVRPDLRIFPLRGNIDTRLRVLNESDTRSEAERVDAIVLAAAGLLRMGWEARISEWLDPEICVPAVAQGALALQCRADDGSLREWLQSFEDGESRLRVAAERTLLQALQGGCQVPIGGYATYADGQLALTGMVAAADGRRILTARASGTDARQLGWTVAAQLRQLGAADMLPTAGQMPAGKVFLVGAGPGDPKLITVRGMEAIQQADVVVYDRLASPRLLRHMRAGAQSIYVGKLPDRHTLKQEEINELLVKLALAGNVVTRLKGGDPAVFGRVGEEAMALAAHAVPFEMVPGVSSAIAVPAYAGIPVTHRGLTSSFAVVTGHECPKKADSDIDWQKLATATGTLVFLMGVKNLATLCETMITCGRDPQTPVALIQWGTCSAQRTVVGTLATIVEQVREGAIGSPAITIVGEVVHLREQLAWYEKKPLFGRKIVVTRARAQASELVRLIEDAGGEALEFPVIRTQPLQTAEALQVLDAQLMRLTEYDWLLFTSVNAVDAFFARLQALRLDIRALRAQIVTVGEKTAAAVAQRGLLVHAVPETAQQEGVWQRLSEPGQLQAGERVLFVRAATARSWLADQVRAYGAELSEAVVYETILDEQQDPYAVEQLQQGAVDAVTFASSSAVLNFVDMQTKYGFSLPPDCAVICIGPVTAETARAAGLSVRHVAARASLESLLAALISKGGA
jgi:uroporphyrinogen III methyltransferase/synthase